MYAGDELYDDEVTSGVMVDDPPATDLAAARPASGDLAGALDVGFRLKAWAECVQRLMATAPVRAVMDETGQIGGHSTPPERKAIREAAWEVVAGWLARDLAALAASGWELAHEDGDHFPGCPRCEHCACAGVTRKRQPDPDALREAARRFLDAEEAYQHSDPGDADDGLLSEALTDARAALRAAIEEAE